MSKNPFSICRVCRPRRCNKRQRCPPRLQSHSRSSHQALLCEELNFLSFGSQVHQFHLGQFLSHSLPIYHSYCAHWCPQTNHCRSVWFQRHSSKSAVDYWETRVRYYLAPLLVTKVDSHQSNSLVFEMTGAARFPELKRRLNNSAEMLSKRCSQCACQLLLEIYFLLETTCVVRNREILFHSYFLKIER